MKTLFLLVLGIVATVSAAPVTSGPFKPALSVWPQPASFESAPGSISIQPGIAIDGFFTCSKSTALTKTLAAVFDRYAGLTFPHAMGPAADRAAAVATLEVTVASESEDYPQLGLDESYNLTVSASSATLSAVNVFGAMRGLESFSQLVTYDFDTMTYIIDAASVTIQDTPRFPHRGLMIDSARHFEPLDSIRAIIRSLAFAKVNVLHWHMSDTQSFPMQSTSSPKLWDASYSTQERYTQFDIAAIIEFARLHGVRVMVEFDMPGHAASWCTGYPDVCPSTTCLQPLNVANEDTFDLVTGLLNEMTGGKSSAPGKPSGLFADNFIHLGGDEVDTSCWQKTPAVSAWLKNKFPGQNATQAADSGYAYFVKRVSDIAIAQGRRPVQWSEVYDHFKTKLDKKTIVHIWKSVTNVTEVVANGYNVLLNVGYDATSWYLDNLNVNWTAVYAQDPCGGSPPELC